MEIDGPVAVLAYSLSHLLANVAHGGNTLASVVDGIDGDGKRIETVETVPGLQRQARTVFDRCVASDARDHSGGVVTLDEIACRAAQEFMHGHAEGLALDVPQSEVDGTDRAGALPAGRIKVSAIHVLPEVLDLQRIATDDAAGAGRQKVLRSTLADACDAGIGLDRDDDVALLEDLVDRQQGFGRIIRADPRYLHFRQSSQGEPRPRECSGAGHSANALQKVTTVHCEWLHIGCTS